MASAEIKPMPSTRNLSCFEETNSDVNTPENLFDDPLFNKREENSNCDSERPQSALARGVQITEYTELNANPTPIPLEESELLLEDYLSPRKLRELTGLEELHEVHFLEMRVDTRETSLGNFGSHLPQLTQLKLSNSIISCARDLGSSLNNVRILWMARSSLEDLDGISSLTSLQELYLAYNEISEISACSMLDTIKILDLEGNNIDDIHQVEFLTLCQKLHTLTLEGNPLCSAPAVDLVVPDYDYRMAVIEILPQLNILDDESTHSAPVVDPSPVKSSLSNLDDLHFLNSLMDEGMLVMTECSANESSPGSSRPSSASRPLTAGLRPSTSHRPSTGMRSASLLKRPGTAYRPKTGFSVSSNSSSSPNRPGSSHSQDETETQSESSDLTSGVVVCGNPSKALRSRKLARNKAKKTQLATSKFKPEHTYDELDEEGDLKELWNELLDFKKDNRKREEEIQAAKAPQILSIDHSQNVEPASFEEGCDFLSEEFSGDQFEDIDSNHGEQSIIGLYQNKCTLVNHDDSFNSNLAELTAPQSEGHASAETNLFEDTSVTNSGLASSRPFSGPNPVRPEKFKLGPVNKDAPKNIDPENPVIRASLYSPEKIRNGPRADTARASITQPQPLFLSRKNAPLSKLQVLPSKFSK